MKLERFADGHLTEAVADGSRVSLRLEAYVEYRLVPERSRSSRSSS